MIIIAQEANKMDITLSILCYSVFNFTEQIKLCSALQVILKYIYFNTSNNFVLCHKKCNGVQNLSSIQLININFSVKWNGQLVPENFKLIGTSQASAPIPEF